MTEVNHECLRLMVEACKWQEIVVATESLTSAQASQPGYSFYRGMALTKLDRVSEAVEQIHHGLSLDPSSRWGNKLLFDVMRSSGKITEAFKGFSEFIDSQQGLESEKAWYVQHAAELSLFDIAAAMNQRREVICSVPPRPKYALALQCFCKADTLDQVFSSLCKLDRATAYALVILQDSEASSNDYHRYAGACEDVRAVISKWHSRLVNSFASVECMANRSNLGTAPSCRRLIDYVTQVYEGFLFIEDDCILAPSALDWSTYHIENTISSTGPAFVTCESSYFDKGDRVLSLETKTRLERLASSKSLSNSFVFNVFVNSTCFGTRSDIWKTYSNIRSFTRGPESLNRFVSAAGIKTIAPVVPRAADIGMLHELGYSVANSGVDNVRERKGTFLLSQASFSHKLCHEFDGDIDLLFAATSKLDDVATTLLESQHQG